MARSHMKKMFNLTSHQRETLFQEMNFISLPHQNQMKAKTLSKCSLTTQVLSCETAIINNMVWTVLLWAL